MPELPVPGGVVGPELRTALWLESRTAFAAGMPERWHGTLL